jgi:prevent-host-death family protein
MCYMKSPAHVGVRELRQNLSVYLARVIAGEVLEVTDRGHAVAVLAPIAAGESIVDRLQREGRLIAASTDLLPVRPVRSRPARWAAKQLAGDRADRRL